MSRDAGLQPQRTALAWSRTAVAIGVNGLLILRGGIQSYETVVSVFGAALAGFAIVLGIATWRRQIQLSAGLAAKPHPLLIPGVCAVTVTACLGGCWLAVER